MHDDPTPASLLVAAWPEVDAAVREGGGWLLDLACGRGRNARHAARGGARTLAIDRDMDALRALQAEAAGLPLHPVRADCERGEGAEIPAPAGGFDVILVFCFLYRPLAPRIAELLRPGGLLLYETFTLHQRELGYGPRNEAFLLEPGELPTLFPSLTVLHHEEGTFPEPKPFALARLIARRD